MADDDMDPLLRVLISVTNTSGLQLGVSLLVGGSWVSGTLISPRMWTTELADEMTKRDVEILRPFFDVVGETLFPSDSEVEANASVTADERSTLPHYAHLRHARVFGSPDPVPSEGFYARVRLAHVEGWTVGTLGSEGYSPPDPPRPVDR